MTSYKVHPSSGKTFDINNIGIIYNIEHKGVEKVVEKLENALEKYCFNFVKKHISPTQQKEIEAFKLKVDLVIVVGGDGTFLAAARYFSKYNIPLLGINTGRLGFLAQIQTHEIEDGIEKILKGKFTVEERLMLQAKSEQGQSYSALNDIVIRGSSITRTAKLFMYINEKHVCDYVADGLIISTPTGSTAYTLSAGGPVLHPNLNAFVIVPICPHALTARPLVVPASEKVRIELKSTNEDFLLTADGQKNITIKGSENIFIEKYNHNAKLISIENNNFYYILRNKLHWGVSPAGNF
ncbi:MAG: NAD(+)/NADH kinase [bacterium]